MILNWDITPVHAPRMTRADAWKKRPIVLKYRQFRDDVNLEMEKSKFPWGSLDILNVDFYIPMPKSWSGKKKLLMTGMPHKQKPDIDNLCKGLLDSIFREGDDCKVYSLNARKFWWSKGRMVITI